jgi:signal peptidase
MTEDIQTLKCRLAEEVLRSAGELRLRVTGSSMLPAVRPGDVLSVCSRSATQAHPGDIILFARQGRLFAHRVVERTTQQGAPYWITRGDRLGYRDPQVSSRELLGRVTSIQRGHRRIVPRLTFRGRVASWILRRSEFLTRMMIRFTRPEGARLT